MEHNSLEGLKSAGRECAEKIVDLTGYGGKLHVNDILPDIKELITVAYTQAIRDAMGLVSTHTEKEGRYCDTGEDMEWDCRSKCTDLAIGRLEKLLPKEQPL